MTVDGVGGLSPGMEPPLRTRPVLAESDEGLPDEGLDPVELQRLRQVLVARFGWETGLEAWHDAVAYSWEHRERLAVMGNPLGYLYRVAQSSVRRQVRWRRRVALPAPPPGRLPDVEPALAACLAELPTRQRMAVVLVHAHGWTHEEAAEVMGVGVSTLRNHLRRGLDRLRRGLGAS